MYNDIVCNSIIVCIHEIYYAYVYDYTDGIR